MSKTPEQIHYNMSQVKNKGTKIETILSDELTRRGLIFETNAGDVFGRPDIVFRDEKLAIFCDGEFWHGFDWEHAKKEIKTNRDFWIEKIEKNMDRDTKVNEELAARGWSVLRFWAKEIQHDVSDCVDLVEEQLTKGYTRYRSIDLFAGIGGIRKGFEQAFGNHIKTVFVSELDKFARKTYSANFETPADINTDITKISETEIPHFDICLAGFPCQAFSIAGYQQGFDDDYKGVCRGTLFFDIARICEAHRPKVIFCENVKGLLSNDHGRTIKTIQKILDKQLDYEVFTTVLNSKDFGVPQNRERVYIVAFDRKRIDSSMFKFPEPRPLTVTIGDILEKEVVPVNYYMGTTYLETLRRHKRNHESKGHGFGFIVRSNDDIAGAIMCGGMGRERNLVIDKRQTSRTPITHIKGEVNDEGIRRMTPREWARLQGFDDDFVFPVADQHKYKQLGNSVTVPVIEAIAMEIRTVLESQKGPAPKK